MRILMSVDEVFDVKPGGHRRYISDLTRRLSQAGHEVMILAPAFSADQPLDGEAGGVRVVRYPASPRPASMLTGGVQSCRRVLDRLLGEQSLDVINVHFAYTGLGVFRSWRAASLPKVFTFYGPWGEEVYLERSGEKRSAAGVRRALMTRIERYCVRRCRICTVLSGYSKKQLMRVHGIPAKDIEIVPGAVDTERYSPGDRDSARSAVGLPLDRPTLLSIRRLVRRMGLDLLIQALVEVRATHPDVLLVIGGVGPLEAELRKQVGDLGLDKHVRFAGLIPDEQLPLYYQAADAFVLPTRDLEGFGLVTAESLACGTPVLATPVAASVEILTRLDPRLLFRAAEPDAIAAGLIDFLSDRVSPDLRDRCAEYVRRSFSWEVVLPKAIAAYERSVSQWD